MLIEIEREAIAAFVARDFRATVTKAEARLLGQALAGYSLQQAAKQDRVSIETKKSQSKSLLSKMGCPDLGHLRAVMLASLIADVG